MFIWAVVSLILVLGLGRFDAYQLSDPVITSAQSQHIEARTGWYDFPLDALPKFGVEDTAIVHATVPQGVANATNYRINPNFDFKVSLSFDYHRVAVPWFVVYDAQQRRTLKKLKVTFTRDEFEIVKVDYEPICETISCPRCLSMSYRIISHHHRHRDRWEQNIVLGPKPPFAARIRSSLHLEER